MFRKGYRIAVNSLIASLFVAFFVPITVFASTFSITPNPVSVNDYYGSAYISHTGNDSTDYWIICENLNPDVVCNGGLGNETNFVWGETYVLENFYLLSGAGTYKIVNYNDTEYSNYGTYTYNDIVNSPDFIQEYNFVVTENGGGGGGYFPVGSTFTKENTQNTILNTLIDWGTAIVAILALIISLGAAYLVFRFGWKKTKRSLGGTSKSDYNDFLGEVRHNGGRD